MTLHINLRMNGCKFLIIITNKEKSIANNSINSCTKFSACEIPYNLIVDKITIIAKNRFLIENIFKKFINKVLKMLILWEQASKINFAL